MKATAVFTEFFDNEKSAGVTLIFCTVISLLIANSPYGLAYLQLWGIEFAGHSLGHWINDGLMTIFFLLIGLELKREILTGELSKLKEAMLPIFGALGGMVVPALIYLYYNWGTETQSGAGIPMATDIAFALGVLSLLGKRVPTSLKVFLTALAVIDDLGAILVIAVFYTSTISWVNLVLALGIFLFLLALNKAANLRTLLPYLIGGVFMWYFMLNSGVHATITGVLLAFVIPFDKVKKKSLSHIMEHFLHKPVAFIILPIFALANTAIVINSNIVETLTQNYSLGIALGLFLGKPLGIFLLAFLSVGIGLCKLPTDINWKAVVGVGFLGGIGFTMSIFVTLLAFSNEIIINNAKLVILLSSLLAGSMGYVFLRFSLTKN